MKSYKAGKYISHKGYISDFFEKNRMSYYDSLAMVKKSDNMTPWLKFFNGIVETTNRYVIV